MENLFSHNHYYIPEFYNKVLKNKKIDTLFSEHYWSVSEKIEYLNYIKKGLPCTPIVLADNGGGIITTIDGYNRYSVFNDFMHGGFDSEFTLEERDLIEKMSIDVYISASPLKKDIMEEVRHMFHGHSKGQPKPSPKEEGTRIISTEKKITIHQKIKIPKKQIHEALKTSVWNKYVGANKGTAPCYACKQTQISQREFDTGHVIAEINGGETNLTNLRPICRKCNLSMGAQNMDAFISKYFS
jgi:hypothetical protein